MANRDLLKEAIADAKALKETAIANAKAALEEAFEPKIKSMLSAKLEEMEKEEMEEEIEEVVTTEAKKEVEEAKEDMDEGYGKEDMDEEMDLDEILAELEKDEEKEDVREAEEDEEVEVDAEESEEDEDEEIDLEDMSEDDLKSFIEDVIADMVEAGELEAGEGSEDEDEMDSEEEIDIDVEDETEELMEGEEEVNEEDLNESPFMDLAMQLRDSGLVDPENAMMAAKAIVGGGTAAIPVIGGIIAAMKDKKAVSAMGEGEEEDMMEEVNALRAELHEVNLLNAKLLYTNKIFRAQTLKEAQKVKVLEAFDKAETVKEVKLVFETLSNEVKATKTVVKENLGRASKPAGVATKAAPIVDVDPQVARWQKLAGLK